MNEMEMMNNEVVEEVVEVNKTNSGKGFKVAGVVLAAGVGAFVIYKLVKKIAAKVKSKREQNVIEATYNEVEDNSTEETE